MISRDEINRRIAAAAKLSLSMGVAPLDESRTHPDCSREPTCSPYMSQTWAHDENCPVRAFGIGLVK